MNGENQSEDERWRWLEYCIGGTQTIWQYEIGCWRLFIWVHVKIKQSIDEYLLKF